MSSSPSAGLTVKQLRAALGELGLATSGLKAALAARLDAARQPPPTTTPNDVDVGVDEGIGPGARGCGHAHSHTTFDCGYGHKDEIAPGLLRGTVAPLLQGLLLPSVAAALLALGWRWCAGGALLLLACVLARAFLVGGAWLPSAGTPSPARVALAKSGGDADALERCLGRRDAFAGRLSAALRCKTVSCVWWCVVVCAVFAACCAVVMFVVLLYVCVCCCAACCCDICCALVCVCVCVCYVLIQC